MIETANDANLLLDRARGFRPKLPPDPGGLVVVASVGAGMNINAVVYQF